MTNLERAREAALAAYEKGLTHGWANNVTSPHRDAVVATYLAGIAAERKRVEALLKNNCTCKWIADHQGNRSFVECDNHAALRALESLGASND